MRTSGLPCRANTECETVFSLSHQDSMEALREAASRRDAHEIVGQLLRLVVAAPGSWTGRYPVGNTGGADVSALRPMPVPDDLRAMLESKV